MPGLLQSASPRLLHPQLPKLRERRRGRSPNGLPITLTNFDHKIEFGAALLPSARKMRLRVTPSGHREILVNFRLEAEKPDR